MGSALPGRMVTWGQRRSYEARPVSARNTSSEDTRHSWPLTVELGSVDGRWAGVGGGPSRHPNSPGAGNRWAPPPRPQLSVVPGRGQGRRPVTFPGDHVTGVDPISPSATTDSVLRAGETRQGRGHAAATVMGQSPQNTRRSRGRKPGGGGETQVPAGGGGAQATHVHPCTHVCAWHTHTEMPRSHKCARASHTCLNTRTHLYVRSSTLMYARAHVTDTHTVIHVGHFLGWPGMWQARGHLSGCRDTASLTTALSPAGAVAWASGGGPAKGTAIVHHTRAFVGRGSSARLAQPTSCWRHRAGPPRPRDKGAFHAHMSRPHLLWAPMASWQFSAGEGVPQGGGSRVTVAHSWGQRAQPNPVPVPDPWGAGLSRLDLGAPNVAALPTRASARALRPWDPAWPSPLSFHLPDHPHAICARGDAGPGVTVPSSGARQGPGWPGQLLSLRILLCKDTQCSGHGGAFPAAHFPE